MERRIVALGYARFVRILETLGTVKKTKNTEAAPKAKEDALRALMIGDVVGKPGRMIVTRFLPEIRARYGIDFVVANAENAAGGSGITPEIHNALLRAGVDCITLGDHAFRAKSIFPILNAKAPRIIRPANFPSEAPGYGMIVLDAPGNDKRPSIKVAVFTMLGRIFIQQPVDNPLTTAEKLLGRIPDVRVRLLDFHAEATSESQIMGRFLDGKVSAVFGTHTHVATADETILPGGTAYQTDVGMTGPFESIIGRRIENVVDNFRTGRPSNFDVADKDVRINGALVDIDPMSGKTIRMERFVFAEDGE